ncbi:MULTISPECIES: hypothetical protein [Calothrix]|uniref:Uncharacterized protein n=2 Tax=Calothrix TaxID=1186 RepID=A0ABR8A5J5_9CYAN|nr:MULTISPECIES: hypothetical protein [Calothrix]MBD2194321.1 hypothetical protein [Calothrix parietina FACHB-288]MBD2227085.1 hypothetical protein [Calothrix anomala FACHB-343]
MALLCVSHIDIESNQRNIESNQHNIEANQHNIESNQHNIESNQHNIESNKHNIESNKHNIESNQHDIEDDILKLLKSNTFQLASKTLNRVGWVEERRRGAASRRVTQHFRRFVGFHFVQPNLHLLWCKLKVNESTKRTPTDSISRGSQQILNYELRII